MMKSQPRQTKIPLNASPWIIVGSTLILLVIVIVLAVQNNHRERSYMSRILKEKGGALIKGMEAGARTGMMGMMWGGQQVQTLLEETAQLPDVLYITITNRLGEVLASSNRQLIGMHLDADPEANKDNPAASLEWRIVKTNVGNDHLKCIGTSCRFLEVING